VGGGQGLRSPPNVPLPITVPIAGCPYRAAALQALKDHGIYHRVLLESPNSSAVEACVRSGVAVGLMEESRMGEGLRQMTELPALHTQHLYLLCDRPCICTSTSGTSESEHRLHDRMIVPTLCVGTPPATLCVLLSAKNQALAQGGVTRSVKGCITTQSEGTIKGLNSAHKKAR
jgi:hypothetical protein